VVIRDRFNQKPGISMKNFIYIPTWKIIEILEHPYCQGIDGKDYEPHKELLQEILWDRSDKQSDKDIKNAGKIY
jgi:hypothetical protein